MCRCTVLSFATLFRASRYDIDALVCMWFRHSLSSIVDYVSSGTGIRYRFIVRTGSDAIINIAQLQDGSFSRHDVINILRISDRRYLNGRSLMSTLSRTTELQSKWQSPGSSFIIVCTKSSRAFDRVNLISPPGPGNNNDIRICRCPLIASVLQANIRRQIDACAIPAQLYSEQQSRLRDISSQVASQDAVKIFHLALLCRTETLPF